MRQPVAIVSVFFVFVVIKDVFLETDEFFKSHNATRIQFWLKLFVIQIPT